MIDVLADQLGGVWSLSDAKTPNETLRFLNAPQAFAFFPEALLVQIDATKK